MKMLSEIFIICLFFINSFLSTRKESTKEYKLLNKILEFLNDLDNEKFIILTAKDQQDLLV